MNAMRAGAALWVSLALVLSGCATPIGIERLSPSAAYRQSLAGPLDDGVARDETVVVLQRFNLRETHARDPQAAIAALHARALGDTRRDIRYALAELCYLQGERFGKEPTAEARNRAAGYFLLAAVYAYHYLLGDSGEPPPSPWDSRFRAACDIYNISLMRGFEVDGAGALAFSAGARVLPVGRLEMSLGTADLPWRLEEFDRFVAADRLAVRGIAVRNRNPGLGMPMVAIKRPTAEPLLGPQGVAISAFLRITGDLADLSAGGAGATLEFHSAFEEIEVSAGGRKIPLATDTTAPIAYMLEDASAWDFGLKAFRGLLHKNPSALYRAQPYQPGRIPVVFVHGTASSPAWWIEMWNTLRADPLLRHRFQFWTFLYPSGNPVVISAADLRDAIREKIDRFDPQGRDPAMGQIVVIGHSQGGLLTKLTAVNSGERLLRSVLDRDLETLPASEKIKADLRRVLMVKPVPEVKRVIFIATPHRGSFLSQQWIRKLIVNLITLPVNVLKEVLTIHQSLTAFFTEDARKHLAGRVPTSIDDMSPRNPTLLALADMPLAPGVKGHSIIAIDGEEKPPQGDDGVVDYASAHLEGLESEFVLQADHSCQGHPLVIEEVRRILLNHLEGL